MSRPGRQKKPEGHDGPVRVNHQQMLRVALRVVKVGEATARRKELIFPETGSN
jgi:hypothetical protein